MNKEKSVKTKALRNIFNAQIGKPINIFNKFSRSFKKFLTLFIWRVIYMASEKSLKSLNEDCALENFINQIKKPKLQEILAKGKKIFIHVPDGKDIHVNKIKKEIL